MEGEGMTDADRKLAEEVWDDDSDWEDCPECGGEGWVSRYEEDPLWYDEDEEWPCELCGGKGGWNRRLLAESKEGEHV
jgi:DnaJ-class molecular chaperone